MARTTYGAPSAVKGLKGSWNGTNRTMSASWEYATKSTWDPDYYNRTFKVDVDFYGVVYTSSGTRAVAKKYPAGHAAITSGNTKSCNVTLSRQYFYPVNSQKIYGIQVRATSWGNPKRTSTGTYYQSKNYAEVYALNDFKAPRKPEITASFNVQTGTVTFRIKTDAGTDKQERYDTKYKVTRTDSSNRNNTYKTEKNLQGWTTSQSTDFTYSYDVTDHQTIAQNQWIKLKCYACARGFAGDSETVVKEYLVAHPAAATISGITATTASNGLVTVEVNTNKSATRPVTTVKLQRLYNTTIGTAASAAQVTQGWEDVSGAVDDAECSGFTDQKSAAVPEVRKHTWYRVVSTYGANSVEGWPVEAKCLYRLRDAASADAIKWRSVSIGEDGESVDLAMGWATDNYTAVQVAWADNPDAWESSEQPKMQVVDWEDATPASGYDHSARFVIRGLEAGKPVYVRARRVKVEEDKVTLKGEWCSPPAQYYPLDVAADPDSVTLFVPDTVARTEGIDCQWEYGGAEITSWVLYRVAGTLRVLARGDGPASRCTVDPSKLGSLTSAVLRLGVTSGAGWLYSADVPVTIADAPEMEVDAPATLDGQPGSIGLSCSIGTAGVRIAVTAIDGWAGGGPDGREPEQMSGDVVWSAALTPDWATDGDGFSATVDMPSGLAFVDGARYLVTASATDPATGLSSGEASAEMAVEWAHQAVEPSDESTVTVDADALTATITPVAPTGAAETDVCDVYRVTPHAVTPVIRGAAFGEPVLDPYAPFSSEEGAEVSYRLCTRTADGDEAWMDVACPLSHKSIVVDWPGGSLSLPYEITKTDRWDTLFSLSTRWDKAKVGHWLASGRHSVRVESRLLRGEDMGKVPLISALAAYSGSCFARFPDGTAFECDVSPSETSISVGSGSVPASFDITEVDPTDAYLGAPAEEEEEEPDA